MRPINCQRCGAEIELPDEIPPSVKAEVRGLIKRSRRLEAMMYLRDKASLTLAQSKAVSFHLSNEDGICHRCGNQLSAQGETVCGKCKSFNLNW
jgi:ribosomal protein L40E